MVEKREMSCKDKYQWAIFMKPGAEIERLPGDRGIKKTFAYFYYPHEKDAFEKDLREKGENIQIVVRSDVPRTESELILLAQQEVLV